MLLGKPCRTIIYHFSSLLCHTSLVRLVQTSIYPHPPPGTQLAGSHSSCSPLAHTAHWLTQPRLTSHWLTQLTGLCQLTQPTSSQSPPAYTTHLAHWLTQPTGSCQLTQPTGSCQLTQPTGSCQLTQPTGSRRLTSPLAHTAHQLTQPTGSPSPLAHPAPGSPLPRPPPTACTVVAAFVQNNNYIPHLGFLLDLLDLLAQLRDVLVQVGAELVDVAVPLRQRLVDGVSHVGDRGVECLRTKRSTAINSRVGKKQIAGGKIL